MLANAADVKPANIVAAIGFAVFLNRLPERPVEGLRASTRSGKPLQAV